jgi:putative endonuclease
MGKTWYVYILECGDGTLYTGITDDLQRRLEAHRSGKGAKYTRGRGPLVLRHQEQWESRSLALRRELAIKKLSKTQKWKLIMGSEQKPT